MLLQERRSDIYQLWKEIPLLEWLPLETWSHISFRKFAMLQKVFINTDSLNERHCEELSGCEAKPKQTRRFLVFTRNRLRNPRKKIATPFRARNDTAKG